MAYIIPVNGDAQPVFATDTANGAIPPSTSTAATPVNLMGPDLDFFHAVANNSVATQQGVQGYVANVIQAVQQTSTVAIYQVDGTSLSFAVYPRGAFASAAGFLAAANITFTGFQLNSATNIGFKLAAS